MIHIVTDSCCDLPQNYIDQYGIRVVPLSLTVDGESFVPGRDISVEEALSRIANAKEMPSTSQPAPADYEAVFRELQEDGPVICFTISSKLSGSFNSANLAARNCGGEIILHDTLQGSCGQGFQVLLAASMAAEGKTVQEIQAALTDYYKQSSIVVILEKYDNAIRSGRVNKVAGTIVQKLNIRAILEVLDGKVSIVDKARGAEKTFQKMVDRIASKALDFSNAIIGIAHFNQAAKAQEYKEALTQRLHPKRFFMETLNATIGVYSDEGGIVISAAPDPFRFGR